MNDRELDSYCDEWVRWCYTRRFYLQPGAQNILARMQPSKVGRPPDARNQPDMQFFHAAIHALADMPEHQDAFACFRLCYCEQVEDIKREADKLGIVRSTYYRRVIAFARKAYSTSISFKAAYASMQDQAQITVD